MDRSVYARLVEELPFQPIADTPTVKHYTDWRVFEERFNMEDSRVEDRIPSMLEHLHFNAVLGVNTRISSRVRGAELKVLQKSIDREPKPMGLIGVHNKMQAYHAYKWNQGLFLDIEDGASIDDIIIASLGGDGYTGHHMILRVGREAEGRIYVVDYAGPSEGLKTFLIEGIIGENASIEFNIASLHSRSHAAYILGHMVSSDESNVRSKVLSLGGAMSRVQIDYIVAGRNARLEALASAVSRDMARADVILNSVNKGPGSDVVVNARGAVFNKGYLALRGSAIVGKEARWASSDIGIQMILMGEDARGYAVPVLEIHSGDVAKANHAAGISHVLEEQRFYLRSRGFSEGEVSRLLIGGILEYSGIIQDLQLNPLELLKI